MRKRTIRNLFRRRLPTRPLNSAAGDGKRHGPRVSCDPFGWDPGCASSVLPNRRSARAGRGEPAATRLRGLHPKSLRVPRSRGGGESVFFISEPLLPFSPRAGRSRGGAHWGRDGHMNAKKGREKSSMPDLIRRQTFRTLKLSAGSIQRFGRESRFTVPGIELFSQLRNH